MANKTKDKFDIIIIGSGIAGLDAALSLIKIGKSVVVFEAKDYAGSRIRTVDVGGAKCDLGATWIEGIHTNPIAKMAKEFNVTTTIAAGDIYSEDEIAFDQTTNKRFDHDLIDDFIEEFTDEDYLEELRDKLPRNASTKDGLDKFSEEKQLDDFEQCVAMFSIDAKTVGMEYGPSSEWFSLEYFGQEGNMYGDYVVFPNGYSQIIKCLAKGVDIRLSTPIKNIGYSGDEIIVTTDKDALFYAKQVIVKM